MLCASDIELSRELQTEILIMYNLRLFLFYLSLQRQSTKLVQHSRLNVSVSDPQCHKQHVISYAFCGN